MVVESIRPQIEREAPIRPTFDHPEVVEALRHGNIYDILRTPGINRRDIEDYLSGQWRLFQNQIIQDYEIYAQEGMVPPPDLDIFPIHSREMSLGNEDQNFFRQEMQALSGSVPEVTMAEGQRPKVQFRAMTVKALQTEEGAGQDVAKITERALNDWQEFSGELAMKVMDAQMVREMQSKGAELNKEIQRIISLVMSGQVDPEYVLIAAAKSNMLQNGTLFSWKGKRIMHINSEMNKISQQIYKMDPNKDVQGYAKEMQRTTAKTRSASTQMQLELMDIQKFAQNIATTLEWVSNAIRQFAQMRQTPTQAIAAR